jgi:hypothetical protein
MSHEFGLHVHCCFLRLQIFGHKKKKHGHERSGLDLVVANTQKVEKTNVPLAAKHTIQSINTRMNYVNFVGANPS